MKLAYIFVELGRKREGNVYVRECERKRRERDPLLKIRSLREEKGLKGYIQCFCWLVQRCIHNHKRILYVTFFVGSYVHFCEFLHGFKDTLI